MFRFGLTKPRLLVVLFMLLSCVWKPLLGTGDARGGPEGAGVAELPRVRPRLSRVLIKPEVLRSDDWIGGARLDMVLELQADGDEVTGCDNVVRGCGLLRVRTSYKL
jgi:hypothetical protein